MTHFYYFAHLLFIWFHWFIYVLLLTVAQLTTFMNYWLTQWSSNHYPVQGLIIYSTGLIICCRKTVIECMHAIFSPFPGAWSEMRHAQLWFRKICIWCRYYLEAEAAWNTNLLMLIQMSSMCVHVCCALYYLWKSSLLPSLCVRVLSDIPSAKSTVLLTLLTKVNKSTELCQDHICMTHLHVHIWTLVYLMG